MPLVDDGTWGGFGPEDFLPGVEDVFEVDGAMVDLSAPTVDIDGDGVLDTRTAKVDDRLVVVTDTDLDGLGDRVTWVDSQGAFECWQLAERVAEEALRWQLVERGELSASEPPLR